MFVVKDRLEVYKRRLLTAVVVVLAAPELPHCKVVLFVFVVRGKKSNGIEIHRETPVAMQRIEMWCVKLIKGLGSVGTFSARRRN